MIIVLMGVMGSGKTTLGRLLAEALGCPFYDADDYHPPSNLAKLERGIVLTDKDREPWLQTLRIEMEKWGREQPRTVLACSALKKKYREILSRGNSITWFYLKGSKELIRKRLDNRKGHFANMDLLENQFEILEEPATANEVDIGSEPNMIIREMLRRIKGMK